MQRMKQNLSRNWRQLSLISLWILIPFGVLVAIAVNYYIASNDMDRYLTVGEKYSFGCHDEATMELDGNRLKALCNGEVYYEEKVVNPEDYRELVEIYTNLETENTSLEMLKVYLGKNKFKLVEVWVEDWDKLPGGGCIVVDNDFRYCPSYQLVWELPYSPLHNFRVGDRVTPTLEAEIYLSNVIPSGTEGEVVELIGTELIRVRFLGSNEETVSNVYWWKITKK